MKKVTAALCGMAMTALCALSAPAQSEDAARAKGVAVNLEKAENIADIMAHGVMSTPGVVIDGKVVHAGGVPGRKKVEVWLGGGSP